MLLNLGCKHVIFLSNILLGAESPVMLNQEKINPCTSNINQQNMEIYCGDVFICVCLCVHKSARIHTYVYVYLWCVCCHLNRIYNYLRDKSLGLSVRDFVVKVN